MCGWFDGAYREVDMRLVQNDLGIHFIHKNTEYTLHHVMESGAMHLKIYIKFPDAAPFSAEELETRIRTVSISGKRLDDIPYFAKRGITARDKEIILDYRMKRTRKDVGELNNIFRKLRYYVLQPAMSVSL